MKLTLYTSDNCGDCIRTKTWLGENGYLPGKDYEEINIATHPEAIDKVMKINHGNQSTPTLVFSDGSTLTEPSNEQLATKINSLS